MTTEAHDHRILRGLAQRVRDLAAQPMMAERRRLWEDHNALQPTRPLISVSPEGCWPELLPESELQCIDPTLRGWEHGLRRRIYLAEVIRDDSVIDGSFGIPWQITRGCFGVDVPHVHGEMRGSYVWDPPIKDLERDFEHLHIRHPRVDREHTEYLRGRAGDIFGDLLDVKIVGGLTWTQGLTKDLALLVGIEQIMFAMIDQPDAVHRLMAFLRDDAVAYLDWAEAEGLVTPNDASNHVGSGGGGYTRELAANADAPSTARDVWGFSESQETVGIGPAMFEEFVLPYQLPLMERFGLNYYGCCEQLETRIDVVLDRVPRLRRVSVAPKADQHALAEKLAGRYVYCRKADPVPVCVEFSEDAIRADIRGTLEAAGGQPLEIILKDTHTVRHEPQRINRWVELARAEARQHTGDAA